MAEISTALIADAKSGNEPAIQALLLRATPALRRHLQLQVNGNRAVELQIDDLLQDTYSNAVRNLHQFRGESPAEFVGWLQRIGENAYIEALRKKLTLRRGGNLQQVRLPFHSPGSAIDLFRELVDDGRSPSSEVAADEAIRRLRLGIASLPTEQRLVVEMCYVEGKTQIEVASVMEKSPPAIRGLLQRAKKKLRVYLRDSTLWL